MRSFMYIHTFQPQLIRNDQTNLTNINQIHRIYYLSIYNLITNLIFYQNTMDIEHPQELLIQPFNPNIKKCGLYLRNPTIIPNIQPKTNVAIPLKHIDYEIEVTNGLTSITLTQKYLNPTNKFLQIDFSFPIDPKSCIYKFVAEFGNKRIQGVVKEKQEAKREYKEAVSQGRQAVYAQIDPNSKDIMNMEIGNLGPGEQVRISISYLQELNVEQNTFYQLHIPSTISPRYMNNHVGRLFAQNLPTAKGQYTWTFKITLLTTRKLVYYVSPSHNLTLLSQNALETQTVLCLAKEEKPNNDLFLLFTVENFHLPNYVLGRTDVSSTAMLSFIPKFCELTIDDAMAASMVKKPLETDMSAAKGEYVFLLDRSGSMGGTRIKKATQALVLFLQSLPEDTYFNVVSFGSQYDFLFKESIKYSQDNLKLAVGKIKKMTADMGGTEIYEPLQQILNKKIIEGYPKQIFLLTDGGVSNTEGVIALVGRQVKYSRCHSIGIGNGCSEALIKGCAEKGKGKFIFIQDSENPSQKIIGLLEQTLTPVIDNVNLKYDKDLVQSIVPNPSSLPYILKNEVVNFYITFKGQLDKKTNFTFGYKDSLNKVPFETIIEVGPESHSVPFVDKMAHSKVIKNLQNSAKDNKPVEDYMYYVKVVDKKKQAIKQSVTHQILSEYTAFICVSKELVDGKFEEIKDKGTAKVKIEPMVPEDFMMEKESRVENICLKSAQLHSTSMRFDKMAKKSSGGGLFSSVLGSISSGVSNFFGGKAETSARPIANKAQMKMSMPSPTLARSRQVETKSFAPKKSQLNAFSFQQQLKAFKNEQMLCKMEAEQDQDAEVDQMINVLKDECEVVKEKKKSIKRKEKKQDMDSFFAPSSSTLAKSAEQPKLPQSIKIENVIQFQKTDGCFDSKDLLKTLFPQKWSDILKQAQEQKIDIAVAITFVVARWIQRNHPQKQYSLIVKKALSFIKKQSFKLQDLTLLEKLIC